MLEWCRSYFMGRAQLVSVNGHRSELKALDTGFPQGSILGPFAYPVYTAPLFKIARKHVIGMHMYADDTQLYVTFHVKDLGTNLARLKRCLSEIKEWMVNNHLKMNDEKTEFMIICSDGIRKKMSALTSLEVGDETVTPSKIARNLGVTLDDSLSMVEHVNHVAKSCYFQLHKISQIRKYLTENATADIVRSLVLSKLDYCNSILYGLPDHLIQRLQLVMNSAARLVFRRRKNDSVSELMIRLHWLPVKYRIEFKVLLLVFKSLNSLAPQY